MKAVDFASACWARAARGIGEDERERISWEKLDAEVYLACDLARLSFMYRDGGKMRLDEPVLKALEAEFDLEREVRSEPDASGDFNFILTKAGTYVARLTPGKLFVEPKACGQALGERLLELYHPSGV